MMMIKLNLDWQTAQKDTEPLVLKPTAMTDVEVARLRRGAVIEIETKSSFYNFTIVNPAMRQGFLSGGLLDAQGVTVKWSGTALKAPFAGALNHKVLSCGGKAIFHIVNGSYPHNFLVTSTILGLSLKHETS